VANIGPQELTDAKLFRRVLIWKTARLRPELSIPALADLLDIPDRTVRRALKLRDHTPKELLEALETEAVRAWRDAIPIAGKKGDHRPAKDLLLHTKAIQPVADAGHAGITVLIGQVLMPGVSPETSNATYENVSNFIDTASCVTDVQPPADRGADGREGDPRGGSG